MASLLVAEDSRTQAERVREDLQGAGHEVTLATDGEAAWALFDASRFDLVLSDVVMPGIDGYELCRRIKEGDRNVPVVLVTSLSSPLDVVQALQAGADNLLRKPYETEHLLGRIETLLYNQQIRETEPGEAGVELFFLKRRFMITADRDQILDLLVSTFEDLVEINERLRVRDNELRAAHEELAQRVEELEMERQRLGAVLAAVPNPMVIVNRQGMVTDVSDACLAFVGAASTEELTGRNVNQVLPLLSTGGENLAPEDRPLLRCMREGVALEIGTSFDVVAERVDGSQVPVIARAAPIKQRGVDITGAVGIMYELDALAAHDPLTNLPTQALLIERVRSAAAGTDQDERVSAVVAVVIDRIDAVRQDLGFEGTDQIVVAVARRLQDFLAEPGLAELPAEASIAYLGNQEFAVVLTGLQRESDAARIAATMIDRLRSIVTVGGIEVTIMARAGVAFPRRGGPEPTVVVHAALAAARDAGRQAGETFRLADPDAQRRATERLRLESELRRAIHQGELVLHYQPQLVVATGAVAGVEALVRWQHPDGELISPAGFLPLAEETGLIVPLGWYVLHQAASQAARWRQVLPGARELSISVNLSPQQLLDPMIAERVSSILAETGLAPDGLVLEITESGMMDDVESAADRLRSLKALGVRLSVDDFGTGYSSLLQLRRFPVDDLKIDRQFVAGMTTDDADAAIVAGTVRLGRTLGLSVVAEGVETVEQLTQLRVLGCDYGQGYYWSKPIAAADFEKWWSASNRSVEHADAVGLSEMFPAQPDDAEGQREDSISYLMHELSSPATVILNYAELLAESADGSEKAREYAAAILRSARSIEGWLSRMSDVRAVGTGSLRLALEERDLQEFAADVLHDLHGQLSARDLRFRVLDTARPRIDSARLAQALSNVLSNAVKYSPAATPIEVEVSRRGEFAGIAVRDFGPGVPPERRNELFRRFARLGSRTQGMGVGLYLARVIARAHGGDLVYEAPVGGGSRFVLTVPLDQPAGASPADVMEAASTGNSAQAPT